MNRYNLINEPWIPVAEGKLVSLLDIFTLGSTGTVLRGDPIQKLAIFRLLLAITQQSWTPDSYEEWQTGGVDRMCESVKKYLNKWKDAFWLYGENPFLQMVNIKRAKKKNPSVVLPMVATGNTTVFTQINREKALNDAELALLLIQETAFALGGKKVDNDIILIPGYNKSKSGKPGPAVGQRGYLHSYVLYKDLLNSLWVNLFTSEEVNEIGIFKKGIGCAPWEQMPEGEDDTVAKDLKNSYMGRLIPLCRFCLLSEKGELYYTEGIVHHSYTEGIFDLSTTVSFSNKPKIKWATTTKKPWRELTAMLAFMQGQQNNEWNCLQLKYSLSKLAKLSETDESFIIWSAGMQVTNHAGEQYLSGNDDYIESEIQIHTSVFNEQNIFIQRLSNEMDKIDKLAYFVKKNIESYYKELKSEKGIGPGLAEKGLQTFWELLEALFPKVIAIAEGNDNKKDVYKKLLFNAYHVYDAYCPKETAHQLEIWVQYRKFYIN